MTTFPLIILVAAIVVGLVHGTSETAEAPAPPQTTNARLRDTAAKSPPAPSPRAGKTTNERLREMALAAAGKACLEVAADLVNQSLSRLEQAAKGPIQPTQKRIAGAMLVALDSIHCQGPNGSGPPALSPPLPPTGEDINNAASARDKLCDPGEHDLVVFCNSSRVLTQEERKNFPGLDEHRHYFQWIVATYEANLPRPECQCQ